MITDIRTSTGAENGDGEIVCTLKFKVSKDSSDLDRWFWFCKHHCDAYDLDVTNQIFMLSEQEALPPFPEGQKTLDEIDIDNVVEGDE